MSVRVRPINANLTHDTETFGKMVFPPLRRTPTSRSTSEAASTKPFPATSAARRPPGLRLSSSTRPAIRTWESRSGTKTQRVTTWSARAPTISWKFTTCPKCAATTVHPHPLRIHRPLLQGPPRRQDPHLLPTPEHERNVGRRPTRNDGQHAAAAYDGRIRPTTHDGRRMGPTTAHDERRLRHAAADGRNGKRMEQHATAQ